MSNKKDKEYMDKLRHSCAHLLAAAVLEVYPEAKPTIGPPIEDGFYYDFDFGEESISKDDLEQIENKMRELKKSWDSFNRRPVSRQTAWEEFEDNKYKKELIQEIDNSDEEITLHDSGDFTDLCRGGHVENPSEEIEAIKLMDVAGAYWRGDEDNEMLTRIYGTCFNSKEKLEEHLQWKKEAKQRDHKKLGKELDLFMFSENIGPGLPVFTPKGNIVRQEILEYCREINKSCGFEEVHTPNINKRELLEISGHTKKFEDGMFSVKSNFSDQEYFLKPMNCPQHTQIYDNKLRSYRDLPIRYSDFANVYRDEKPGELGGITRTKCFGIDDGHIFCRQNQIKQEYNQTLDAIEKVLSTFGLDYEVVLSLWNPQNKQDYLGEDELWQQAQTQLRELLEDKELEYSEEEGEAAFYGPKMDFIARDALKREWDISTIQIDLNLPNRFDLEYVDEDGDRKTPIMIHRAMIGSLERFLGILIEHYRGEFPVWLSPTQVHFVPVSSEDHIEGTQEIADEFRQEGIRVSIDDSDESVGKRIRNAVKQKTPYILVIGDDELGGDKLSVRMRDKDGEEVDIERREFINRVKTEIENRAQKE